MVARTNTSERIDIQLHAVESALADLPEVVEEWDELPDGERASWSLDWDHLMGSYFPMLQRFHGEGQMTLEQTRRYDLLRICLAAAFPLIDRLDLYRPPILHD